MSEIQSLKAAAQKSGLGPQSAQGQWAINEIKAKLDSYKKWIHTLLMFGSYALSQAGRHSDIDFLVLMKKGKHVGGFHKTLLDLKLALRKKSKDPVEIQIVSFDEKSIKCLFKLSMPLAHAIRHGVVIWDDGWFETLLSRPYPKWPDRGAAVKAFTQWIVPLYYRCSIDLKREISAHHGPVGICTQQGKCIGHPDGDLPARVISRMLYVTLPDRGFLPLCKPEVINMAVESYGRKAWRPVCLAFNILQKDRLITFGEFQVLFSFAKTLFDECIRICGPENPEVIKSLSREYQGGN
ncbi:MAG: nucleotidyltransferase domain-containing protein [Thermodesulfobacteriota bacterium]|nr:nucleotidyltransferase domain-containing protein [Thermodesulfobacteriota bacterium]